MWDVNTAVSKETGSSPDAAVTQGRKIAPGQRACPPPPPPQLASFQGGNATAAWRGAGP